MREQGVPAGLWTVETLAVHYAALRAADLRFAEERDRRYAEVNTEKEKALKIKETADLAALQLAREIQTYKDEKANQLREQIGSERGDYATKNDLSAAMEKIEEQFKPVNEYIAAARGRGMGISSSWTVFIAVVGLIGTLVSIGSVVVVLVIFLSRQAPAAPSYVPAPSGTVLPVPPAVVPPSR